MTAVIMRPSSSEVRAFAIENGLAEPGAGRLSKRAIDAFNASRRGIHRYVKSEDVARHTVYGPKGGVVRTRNYKRSEARVWAVANGFAHPGSRGKLSVQALDAYIMSL